MPNPLSKADKARAELTERAVLAFIQALGADDPAITAGAAAAALAKFIASYNVPLKLEIHQIPEGQVWEFPRPPAQH